MLTPITSCIVLSSTPLPLVLTDTWPLLTKTKAILGIIFYNFWSNKEEKKEFEKILRENEIKKEEEADNLYKYEDLFKNKTNVINENNLPVEIKDKWYEKIANFLKKAFHIKK